MGVLRTKTKIGATIDNEVYDTLGRLSYDTLIDRSRIINKVLIEYFNKINYEVRLNTEEEAARTVEKKRKK